MFELYIKQKNNILSLNDIGNYICQTFTDTILNFIQQLIDNHFIITKHK